MENQTNLQIRQTNTYRKTKSEYSITKLPYSNTRRKLHRKFAKVRDRPLNQDKYFIKTFCAISVFNICQNIKSMSKKGKNGYIRDRMRDISN